MAKSIQGALFVLALVGVGAYQLWQRQHSHGPAQAVAVNPGFAEEAGGVSRVYLDALAAQDWRKAWDLLSEDGRSAAAMKHERYIDELSQTQALTPEQAQQKNEAVISARGMTPQVFFVKRHLENRRAAIAKRLAGAARVGAEPVPHPRNQRMRFLYKTADGMEETVLVSQTPAGPRVDSLPDAYLE